MISKRFWIPLGWLSIMMIFLALGCAPKTDKKSTPQPTGFPEIQEKEKIDQNATSEQPVEEYFIHKVIWSGESLSIIAKWYIGRLKDWELLAKHNPEKNPNQIYVGDSIKIPKSKMKTLEPMPYEFLDQFVTTKQDKDNSEPKEEVSATEDETTESDASEDLELFGPKGLEDN